MLIRIGSLWKKKAKNEGVFFSGQIVEGLAVSGNIMIFPNTKKEDNQPDAYIYISNGKKPEEEQETE